MDRTTQSSQNQTRLDTHSLDGMRNETGGDKVTNTTNMTRVFNFTLYAHWTVNNYTITFDYGNGTNTSTEFKYNETIIYPENLTREGYTFSEWDPKPERMPANDTTHYMHNWQSTTTQCSLMQTEALLFLH